MKRFIISAIFIALLTLAACSQPGGAVVTSPPPKASPTASATAPCKLPLWWTVALSPGQGEEIGAFLVEHPNIRFIAFTGSREVGTKIWESAAMIRPAPSSHSVASNQREFPVAQKTRSQTNVATKNAIGNGISIGWIGCPAMLAVLRGFRDGFGGAIVMGSTPEQKSVAKRSYGKGNER